MAYSEVQICNLALSHVGVSQAISSLTSASNEARQCNLHYPVVRDLLLRDFAWPFAKKFRTLGLVAEADDQEWADDWDFAYRYPADAVRVLGFLVGARGVDPVVRPLEIAKDDQGLLLLCNEEDARIVYTSRATDPARFTSDFVDALAWKLASRLAMPLAVRPDLRQQADQEFQAAIAAAKVSALNERIQPDAPDAEHIRARE